MAECEDSTKQSTTSSKWVRLALAIAAAALAYVGARIMVNAYVAQDWPRFTRGLIRMLVFGGISIGCLTSAFLAWRRDK